MKLRARLLFFYIIFLGNHLFAQSSILNVASLKSGAFLSTSPLAYAATRNNTAKIDDWSSEALMDENGKVGWCSKKGNALNQVFVIELSEEYIIEKFNFNNSCEKAYAGLCAKNVSVELSSTSAQTGFKTIDNYTLPEFSTSNQFTITPQRARWIRLTIRDNYGNSDYTELMEFEAWGKFANYAAPQLDITGVWNSNWGWVSMNKNKYGYVYGCYKYNNGTLDAGELNRRVFEFKWDEKFQKGWATLVVNQEGNRITGVWGFNNDRSKFGFWDFTMKTTTPYLCETDQKYADKVPDKYAYPQLKIDTNVSSKTPELQTTTVANNKEYVFNFHIVEASNNTNIDAKIIVNKNEKNVKTIQSDLKTGNAVLALEKKNSYTISIEKEGYLTYTDIVSLSEDEKNKEVITRNFAITKIEVRKAIVLNNVLFEQGTATLLQVSYPELEKLVKMMVDNPSIVIELSGHTDNQGDASLNLKLSKDRVAVVEKYLISKGIDKKRVSGIGYGSTKPIADNKKEQSRKLNRRVELSVIKF